MESPDREMDIDKSRAQPQPPKTARLSGKALPMACRSQTTQRQDPHAGETWLRGRIELVPYSLSSRRPKIGSKTWGAPDGRLRALAAGGRVAVWCPYPLIHARGQMCQRLPPAKTARTPCRPVASLGLGYRVVGCGSLYAISLSCPRSSEAASQRSWRSPVASSSSSSGRLRVACPYQ